MTDRPKSFGRRAAITGLALAGFAAVFGAATFLPGMVSAADDGNVSDAEAYQRQQSDAMIIVDVRTAPEWQQTGIATGALTVDLQDPDFIKKMVQLRQSNPDKEIGFICASSNRSAQVQKALVQAGFDRVYSVFGGMTGNGQVPGWIADGLPVEKCC
jgi:rhodanese-related sulfurtransferase